MNNVRVHAYERQHGFELVLQVRLAGAGVDDWTTIKSLATKPTKEELKKILDGTIDWLNIIQENYPSVKFEYGYRVGKAPRGKRY